MYSMCILNIMCVLLVMNMICVMQLILNCTVPAYFALRCAHACACACARVRTRAYERAHRRRIQSSAAPCACACARVRNPAHHPSETRRMRVLGILRIAEEMSVMRMKRKIRSVRVGVCTGHVRRLYVL